MKNKKMERQEFFEKLDELKEAGLLALCVASVVGGALAMLWIYCSALDKKDTSKTTNPTEITIPIEKNQIFSEKDSGTTIEFTNTLHNYEKTKHSMHTNNMKPKTL